MKHLVFAILENKHGSEEVLNELSKAGYNGTVIPSTSLKHSILSGGETPMFFNALHLDTDKFENNSTLFIVCDEEEVKNVQNIIRSITENFSKAKGGMFVVPLESFEGSF